MRRVQLLPCPACADRDAISDGKIDVRVGTEPCDSGLFDSPHEELFGRLLDEEEHLFSQIQENELIGLDLGGILGSKIGAKRVKSRVHPDIEPRLSQMFAAKVEQLLRAQHELEKEIVSGQHELEK